MTTPTEFQFTDYQPYDFANRRHIGPSPAEMTDMLKVIGYNSLDGLIDGISGDADRRNAAFDLQPFVFFGKFQHCSSSLEKV